MMSFRNLLTLASCLIVSGLRADEASNLVLRSAVQVDGEGVFLHQLVSSNSTSPYLRLSAAPTFGKTSVLTRAQVAELAETAGFQCTRTNWTGSEAVRISRRTRVLPETEALQILTATLQQQHVKDKGQLELRFSRPWTPLNVPDEALTLEILELPAAGVGPSCIVRVELQTARGERLGPWQASLQAKVWRDIWVAQSALKRGEPLEETGLARERRDVLALHDTPADFVLGETTLELAEPVQMGSPLLARAVKARPIIHRGQTTAAMFQEGALVITMKVEALEDGVRGQMIRARNPISRRDVHGLVVDEQTILVSL